jgi:hypothetical protein
MRGSLWRIVEWRIVAWKIVEWRIVAWKIVEVEDRCRGMEDRCGGSWKIVEWRIVVEDRGVEDRSPF